MLIFFTNSILRWAFALVLSSLMINGFELFLRVSLCNNSQVMILHSWCFINDPTLFLQYINGILDIICNIAIYADDTTLYSKRDQASDLWLQLKLASEFESDLQDTEDWGRRRFVDFNAGKTQLLSFDWFSSSGAIDVKMRGSILAGQSSIKMLGLSLYCLNCLQENWSLDSFYKVLFSWLLLISVNLPNDLSWNTVVISGLLLLQSSSQYFELCQVLAKAWFTSSKKELDV